LFLVMIGTRIPIGHAVSACCRIEPQFCGRSPSRPSPCRHAKPAVDRMRQAPCRSARQSWLRAAIVPLPDWTIVACAKIVLCHWRSYCPARGTARK
jgi:hypothetical protein